MIFLFLLCCLLRTVCLPIPETVLFLWGSSFISENLLFLLMLVGTVISFAITYSLSHYFLIILVKRLKWENKVDQFCDCIRKYKEGIISVLFIVPVFPDIIVCAGAALMHVRFSWFIFLAVVSKAVSLGMLVYSQQIAQCFSVKKWQVLVVELAVLNLLPYIPKVYRYVFKKTE